MDAKGKVDEMLRRKRAEADTNKPIAKIESDKALLTATSIPKPELPQHGSALNCINALLKQRQSRTDQPVLTPVANITEPTSAVPSTVLPTVTPTVSMPAVVSPTVDVPQYGLCQSCTGTLELREGLFVCRSCGCRYTRRVADGLLLDCRQLPYGHCQCCELRRPLIKPTGRRFPCCSANAEEYVLVAGSYQRLSQLPFGLCSCCPTPNPLMATPDRLIRCALSGMEYVHNFDGSIVPKPHEVELESVNSIEAALNDGNAAFYYGGFIVGQEERPRRRRRR
ncbi:MAG: hypothetical protein AB1489_11635 [Acidobacteriota bacterium]